MELVMTTGCHLKQEKMKERDGRSTYASCLSELKDTFKTAGNIFLIM